MIRFLFRTACAGVFLGGWGLAALSLHVVRTPDKIGLIPKERLGVIDTYVDARTWKLSDLPAHAPLVRRLLEADKAELFGYMAEPTGGDIATQLQSAIQGAPAEQADTVMGKVKGMFPSRPLGTFTPNTAGYNLPSIPLDF